MTDFVRVELTKIGNQVPYFSCTGTFGSLSGCCHELIEETYPGVYTDVITLHLSDIDGVPLHAVENGYYFLGDAMSGTGTYETVAKHLRISVDEAKQLRNYTKEQFSQFVEEQKPRWKVEADAAIKKYNL